MLSYLNSPAIKAKYIARMQAHIAADELIQGTGWAGSKGCSIGCTFDAYSHLNYPDLLGLPAELAHMNDAIFEGLSKAAAKKFALDFLKAVPVGVDCSSVLVSTAIARHERSLVCLAANNEPYAVQCKEAIQGVIDWFKNGQDPEAVHAVTRVTTAAKIRAYGVYPIRYGNGADVACANKRKAAELAACLVDAAELNIIAGASEAVWEVTDSDRAQSWRLRSKAVFAAYKLEATTLILHLKALGSF